MRIIKQTVTVGMVGLLSLALTACGGDEPTPGNTSPTVNAPAGDEATDDEAMDDEATDEESDDETDESTYDNGDDEQTDGAGGNVGGGSWSIEVGGEPLEIEDGIVTCDAAADASFVGVTSGKDMVTGIGVYLSAGDAPTVRAVTVKWSDSSTLSYGEDMEEGSATATKDGKIYTITGEGTVVDGKDPMKRELKPFDIKVECE